jgi:hypothetical protein
VQEGGRPLLNGSISRSLTSIPPSGEYPEARPMKVMMSGWYWYRCELK